MNTHFARCLVTTGLAIVCMNSNAGVTDETFARFVGTWNMELMAHEQTFGDRGGPGTGVMECDWGLSKAWVDCAMDSNYTGLGQYALRIVLYRLRGDGEIGAFVTNSFGGGRLYEGTLDEQGDLVFHDAWIDPTRKWEHQRTVYRFADDGSIRFAIDVAADGASFLPHSSGVYRRQ